MQNIQEYLQTDGTSYTGNAVNLVHYKISQNVVAVFISGISEIVSIVAAIIYLAYIDTLKSPKKKSKLVQI
jgi:hypothetical protein